MLNIKNMRHRDDFFHSKQYTLALISFLTLSMQISAHGAFEQPISRIYGCYLEGPENPMSAACQEAVNVGGVQPLYDWNEVNQGMANGDHISVIENGTLCAGGRDKYAGLNLAYVDWIDSPLTLNSSGDIEFVYYATAPHATAYFRFFVTNNDYDLSQKLNWDDLDPAFCEITTVTLDVDQRYRMSCPMPTGKSGRHIIYNIWQRGDSPEAFYACIDVDFGVNNVIDLIFKNNFETQK